MKKLLLKTSRYWYIILLVFYVLEILNYSVLKRFFPLSICFCISVCLTMLLTSYLYFQFSLQSDEQKKYLETKNKEFDDNIKKIAAKLDNYIKSYGETQKEYAKHTDLKEITDLHIKELEKLSNDINGFEEKFKKNDKELDDIQDKIKHIPNTIMLPIGQCLIKEDNKTGEIQIISDGKYYKFGIENGEITTYTKNGQPERYGGR